MLMYIDTNNPRLVELNCRYDESEDNFHQANHNLPHDTAAEAHQSWLHTIDDFIDGNDYLDESDEPDFYSDSVLTSLFSHEFHHA